MTISGTPHRPGPQRSRPKLARRKSPDQIYRRPLTAEIKSQFAGFSGQPGLVDGILQFVVQDKCIIKRCSIGRLLIISSRTSSRSVETSPRCSALRTAAMRSRITSDCWSVPQNIQKMPKTIPAIKMQSARLKAPRQSPSFSPPIRFADVRTRSAFSSSARRTVRTWGRKLDSGHQKPSLNFGRIPVSTKSPITSPVSRMPRLSKTKMSCMVTTSPSMPVISAMLVTLRVPSLRRLT